MAIHNAISRSVFGRIHCSDDNKLNKGEQVMHYHFVIRVEEEDIQYVKQTLVKNDDELLGAFIKYTILSLFRSIQVWEKPS